MYERMIAPTRRRVRPSSPSSQTDLLAGPWGCRTGSNIIRRFCSSRKGGARARGWRTPVQAVDFQGFLANRQVVSFGYRYDYDRRAVVEAAPFPAFLDPLRRKVAELFDRPADAFRQVLFNEYRPAAGIGWHREAQFDEVIGVSLLRPYVLRFRRKSGAAWNRATLTVQPRSAYLLSGLARTGWEPSIPVLDHLRYSITLRALVASDQERPLSASSLYVVDTLGLALAAGIRVALELWARSPASVPAV